MIELDEKVYQLITRRGFVQAFWAELRRRRAEEPRITHQEVYEALECLYLEQFGETRFPSFGAFAKYRDKIR